MASTTTKRSGSKRQAVKRNRQENQSGVKIKMRKNVVDPKIKKNVNNAVIKKPKQIPAPPAYPISSIEPILYFGYKFIRILGRGSEGTVFLAKDLLRDRLVAIKTLDMDRRRQLQPVQRAMGLGEFWYWSHLNHPNLMKLIEKVAFPDHIFYVMEYTSNGTLLEYIRNHRRRNAPMKNQNDEQLMVKWTRELLFALQYLHWLGLYHLDIKPDNVFLDENWNLKLGDFGFLRAKHDPCTRICLGCPAYMPPEALTVKKLSDLDLSKVDVWSLGVTIFEMLTGRIVSGTNFYLCTMRGNVILKNININIPRLAKMDIGYPGGKDFTLKLLDRNPELRPSPTSALTHPWLRLSLSDLELPSSY